MGSNIERSILFPNIEGIKYNKLDDTSFHDLALDIVCKEVTRDAREQAIVTEILSHMTDCPEVSSYRQDVFEDFKNLPEMRAQLVELFEKIEFNKGKGSIRKAADEKEGIWYLMHRLNEYSDYVKCVDALRVCLGNEKIKSAGLKGFKAYVDELYSASHFDELKKDIENLQKETVDIQSVTVGINVNNNLEAESMGLISINNKKFKKSNIVSNFSDALSKEDKIQDGNDWNGDMHYRYADGSKSVGAYRMLDDLMKFQAVSSAPFATAQLRQSTVASINEGDGLGNSTYYLENILNKMLDSMVKKIKNTLDKYKDVVIGGITAAIPEFVYYIRMVEFIERLEKKGFTFTKALSVAAGETSMKATGLYNMKLAISMPNPKELVINDLDFDKSHTIYILTGANRGGKTTITQAVGMLFALAQGGVYVPASSFEFAPADCIYTHFPADEDKTLDLGRLGEECVRFKEIYTSVTSTSLLLMNETFSTTSFEEGYYIAFDSVKALLTKGPRTIYNTHMHKLAVDAPEYSADMPVKASSLIVKSEGGNRSFKVEIAPPEGLSYASDIAKKYGVTYDMLTSSSEAESGASVSKDEADA